MAWAVLYSGLVECLATRVLRDWLLASGGKVTPDRELVSLWHWVVHIWACNEDFRLHPLIVGNER